MDKQEMLETLHRIYALLEEGNEDTVSEAMVLVTDLIEDLEK